MGKGAHAFAGLVPRLTGSFFPRTRPPLSLAASDAQGRGSRQGQVSVWAWGSGPRYCFLPFRGNGQSLCNISQYRLGVRVGAGRGGVGWGVVLGSTRTKCNKFLCHSVFCELSATECSVCFLIVVVIVFISYTHFLHVSSFRFTESSSLTHRKILRLCLCVLSFISLFKPTTEIPFLLLFCCVGPDFLFIIVRCRIAHVKDPKREAVKLEHGRS